MERKKMELIKGSAVAASISKSISETIEKTGMIPPHLAIIRVGEKADDISYEKSAIKRMDKVGIHHTVYTMEDTVSQEEFLKVFDQVNQDPKVDGILLLRPLPSQLDEHLIERRIDPEKDVDGIGPINMAHVYAGTQMGYAPCTAEAVMKILLHRKEFGNRKATGYVINKRKCHGYGLPYKNKTIGRDVPKC